MPRLTDLHLGAGAKVGPGRPGLIREVNVRRLLQLLRLRGLLSQADLARQSGLSLIERAGTGRSNGGRRPTMLRFNTEFGYVIGAEVRPSRVHVALANLNGTVAGWGVQPENWYWTEAGFTTLGVQRDYKEGVREDAPAVLFQELAMLGASAGAEVYSFEGMDLGSNSSPFLQTVLPPLIRILTAPVIPRLEDVKAATFQAHALNPSDLIFGEPPRGDSSSRLVSLLEQLSSNRPPLRCFERITRRLFPQHPSSL